MFARAPARFVLQSVCACLRTQSFSHTACRNTVVVERWWQVPLSKEGSAPRLHPRRHRVYRLVEDTKHNMKDKMELLLTQTVPKLGGRGDTVFVKKSVGRNKLLAEGLAVYPSPENKELFAEERRLLREGKREDRIQTRTGQLTVEFLKKSALEIGIQPAAQQQFHLTKEIVCRQFLRKLGVVVPPHALTLPDEPITQFGDFWCEVTLGVVVPPHALTLPDEPITQFGDFWCEVTVNGLDPVRVLLSVGPYVEPRKKKLMKLEAEAAAATTENKPETDPE